MNAWFIGLVLTAVVAVSFGTLGAAAQPFPSPSPSPSMTPAFPTPLPSITLLPPVPSIPSPSATVTLSPANRAVASEQVAQEQPVVPDLAVTGRFTEFFAALMAGRAPAGNLSNLLKSALTPAILAQAQTYYGRLGAFQKLQFTGQDMLADYHRYHYSAIFDRGSKGITFVTDKSGAIAGFFRDHEL